MKSKSLLSYRAQAWLFCAPFLVGAFVFIVLPTLATIFIAFTEYDGVAAPDWVGLENFSRLLTSPYPRHALRNTLIFVLLAVPLRLIGALSAALLLQNPGKAFGFYRAAIYLPTIIPEVAYALIWLWIFNPLYGPLNIALTGLGLPAPAWLVAPGTARLAIVIMLAFQIGEGLVIVLAGLQNVPRAYYEAAKVDGASAWQSFWQITLPLLTPWLLLLSFRDMIVSLQRTFTPTFTMTYGGPYFATTFAPLFVYEATFDFNDYGLAAAFLLITYLVLGLLIYAVLNLSGRGEAVSDA